MDFILTFSINVAKSERDLTSSCMTNLLEKVNVVERRQMNQT